MPARSHGMSKGSCDHHPLYDVWSSMIQRCHNPNNNGYSFYGKRGITVCHDWKTSFEAFYTWSLENDYQKGLQIDRIDVNKGYSPFNCRFVSTHVQARNRRSNTTVEHSGKTLCLQDISNQTNISRSTLLYRHKQSKPLTQSKNVRSDSVLGLNIKQERIRNGWTIKHVAQQVGLKQTSIQNIETGKNKPSYDVLIKLEDLYQKPHRWLFAVAADETPAGDYLQ